MSTVLYDEDDDFTCKVDKEEEIPENVVNQPNQIVWANDWDIEKDFKVHIRMDTTNEYCKLHKKD